MAAAPPQLQNVFERLLRGDERLSHLLHEEATRDDFVQRLVWLSDVFVESLAGLHKETPTPMENQDIQRVVSATHRLFPDDKVGLVIARILACAADAVRWEQRQAGRADAASVFEQGAAELRDLATAWRSSADDTEEQRAAALVKLATGLGWHQQPKDDGFQEFWAEQCSTNKLDPTDVRTVLTGSARDAEPAHDPSQTGHPAQQVEGRPRRKAFEAAQAKLGGTCAEPRTPPHGRSAEVKQTPCSQAPHLITPQGPQPPAKKSADYTFSGGSSELARLFRFKTGEKTTVTLDDLRVLSSCDNIATPRRHPRWLTEPLATVCATLQTCFQHMVWIQTTNKRKLRVTPSALVDEKELQVSAMYCWQLLAAWFQIPELVDVSEQDIGLTFTTAQNKVFSGKTDVACFLDEDEKQKLPRVFLGIIEMKVGMNQRALVQGAAELAALTAMHSPGPHGPRIEDLSEPGILRHMPLAAVSNGSLFYELALSGWSAQHEQVLMRASSFNNDPIVGMAVWCAVVKQKQRDELERRRKKSNKKHRRSSDQDQAPNDDTDRSGIKKSRADGKSGSNTQGARGSADSRGQPHSGGSTRVTLTEDTLAQNQQAHNLFFGPWSPGARTKLWAQRCVLNASRRRPLANMNQN